MGMTASSSIVPLSGPSSSRSISSASIVASTPLMSRTSSEASTSTTSSTSTTLTDDFRFEDDEEDNQEELDDDTDDEDIYSSSDANSSRGAGHSSCPSSSSLDSFTLPRDCFPSSSSSLASFSIASSSSSSSSKAKQQQQQTRIETPYTFPSPTPISELRASDLEASLRFSSSPNGSPASPEEDSAPPAFFPLQRVSFAPQLKIKTQGGVPLAMTGSNKSNQHGISGMMLGVTGTIEVLDAEKSRKTGR